MRKADVATDRGPIWWVALVIAISLVGVSLGAFHFIVARGESLYDCQFRLLSNKEAYKLGEEIILTVEIIPQTSRSLTLGESLHQNILFWQLEERKEGLYNQGMPVCYKLAPENPLRFEIRGHVSPGDDGRLWVDLGEYGKGLINDKRFPPLRFSVLPYRIRLADSVEWGGSNELKLRMRD